MKKTIISIYPPCAVTTWRSQSTKLAEAYTIATVRMLSHAAEMGCSSSAVVCGMTGLLSISSPYGKKSKGIKCEK